ncbi:MAG: hypothetical protein R6X33_11625 [Candidatus Brocadiia bacterium]
MHEETLEDCYCRWDEQTLVVGNDLIERAYDLSEGLIRPTALTDKVRGREWLPPDCDRVLFRLPGMEEEPFDDLSVRVDTDDNGGLSAEFLRVALTLTYPSCTVTTTLSIHPGVPAASTAHHLRGRPTEQETDEPPVWEFQGNRSIAGEMKKAQWPRPDTVESLPLPGSHLRARAVQLFDVTDVYNWLVREEDVLLYGPGFEKLRGNLLFVEDTVEPAGLFLVKNAPNPVGQLNYHGYDFHTAGRDVLEVRGTGLRPNELDPDRALPCYGCTVGIYDPTAELGAERALRRWHDAVDHRVPERDTYILANTWGNRSRDTKVCAEFMKAEMDRAAELGVDVCQIDYGWQRGSTTDPADGVVDKSDRYRDKRSDFWQIRSDRFPEEFEDVAAYGRECGVKLGVWFAPDDWNHFADWERDRHRLVELHEQCGVSHFKLDIFDIESKLGEDRLVRMLEGIMSGTDGRAALQMDLTMCRRLGFFYHPEIGEIFLENRYTDWGNYYPHYTLRNLWQLSRFVPSRRLQMEFLDLDRNPDNYPDDPLAPHRYPPDYAFATTMVGQPLAWMELSELDEEEVAALKPIIAAYSSERERLFDCEIWPIGEEPSGTSWTGFQALHPDGGGYLLLFREMNDRPEAAFTLHDLRDCSLELEVCHGPGFGSDGRVDDDGRLTVRLAEPRSYAFVRYGAP